MTYLVKNKIATYDVHHSVIYFKNESTISAINWTIENEIYSFPFREFMSCPKNELCRIHAGISHPNPDRIEWVLNARFLFKFCFSLDFKRGVIGLAKK